MLHVSLNAALRSVVTRDVEVLAEAGVGLALPTALTWDAPLIFRAWTPGAALSPGAFGMPAPLADQT